MKVEYMYVVKVISKKIFWKWFFTFRRNGYLLTKLGPQIFRQTTLVNCQIPVAGNFQMVQVFAYTCISNIHVFRTYMYLYVNCVKIRTYKKF